MLTPKELQKELREGSDLSLKVLIMHDKIVKSRFGNICQYNNNDYFDRPEGYYFYDHPEDKDYGAIICLRSGLIVCIELQDNITKVMYSSRTNQPFTEKMLEQKKKIEIMLKDYIDIV
jgi:hypothetical protein